MCGRPRHPPYPSQQTACFRPKPIRTPVVFRCFMDTLLGGQRVARISSWGIFHKSSVTRIRLGAHPRKWGVQGRSKAQYWTNTDHPACLPAFTLLPRRGSSRLRLQVRIGPVYCGNVMWSWGSCWCDGAWAARSAAAVLLREPSPFNQMLPRAAGSGARHYV